jgi:hypothetical protein
VGVLPEQGAPTFSHAPELAHIVGCRPLQPSVPTEHGLFEVEPPSLPADLLAPLELEQPAIHPTAMSDMTAASVCFMMKNSLIRE